VTVIHIEAIFVPLKKFVKESVFVLYNNRKNWGVKVIESSVFWVEGPCDFAHVR